MNELESKMNENQRFKRRSNDAILDKLRVMYGEMGLLLNHKCHIIEHYQECGDCREYNRLDASYTKWCLSYVAGIFAREKHPPEGSAGAEPVTTAVTASENTKELELVSQGAESADIGKLDAADKSGVEMGKVNRVDEKESVIRDSRIANDPTSQSEGETAFYERLDDMIAKNGGTMPEREDNHE